MKFLFVLIALTMMATTPAMSQTDDADLLFITQPIIDVLVSRLSSSDQQSVNGWLELDQNTAVLNKSALEGMSTGAFPANAGSVEQAPAQMAIDILVSAGLPSSVLGESRNSADYLEQILAVVSEADANQLNLYFQALPAQKEAFLSFASTQPTPWEALKLIGYPMSEDMTRLASSQQNAAEAEKWSRLFDRSRMDSFCEGLAGLPQEDFTIEIVSIVTEGLSSGFLIAAEDEYYSVSWSSMDDSTKATLEVMSPNSKYDAGPLSALKFAVMNVTNEQLESRARSLSAATLGGINPFSKNRSNKKEQRAFADSCVVYVGAYLEELGL